MRIREFRNREQMTTIELGKRLGVSPSAITNWEKGVRRPDVDMLCQLARVLGCTPNDLLGFETEEKPAESVRDIVVRRVEEAQRGAAL